MAECSTCNKVLKGDWWMSRDKKDSSFDTTGRYLCIKDGYFLNGAGPNFVQSYCRSCWINEIFSLPFVSAKVKQLEQTNTWLEYENMTL